jgi:ATP-dependent Lon protease
MSPETGIIRNYLDWLFEVPWKKATKDNLNVRNAAKILDLHHYGLEKQKERLLEYIAVKTGRRGIPPTGVVFPGSARNRQDFHREIDG